MQTAFRPEENGGTIGNAPNRSNRSISSNYRFSCIDENVFLAVTDRYNVLTSSDFACTHLFDPKKMMEPSEFDEIAKINRFHRLIDRIKN